jgi:pantothenate kinase-related protein Tda10
MIDSWIIIQVGDPHWVYKWRQQVWNQTHTLFTFTENHLFSVRLALLASSYNSLLAQFLSHAVWLFVDQAEARMRADGGSGMTDEQVRCTSCLPGAKIKD